MVRAPALLIALLALAVAAPTTLAAGIPGVKAGDSVLFAMDAASGTLVAKKRENRYVLTLEGVDRGATWFADRPARDAGQIATKRLFRSWKRLGFAKVPPNAALTVTGAKAKRDTMAVELTKLRSYDARKRVAKFAVRRLGSLGHGLRHLNRRIDQRVPRRFANASLFVDNVVDGQCALGQPTLFPIDEASGLTVTNMIPADGRLLQIRSNPALFSIYGTFYGGDGETTFGIPKLTPPLPGSSGWYICTQGIYLSAGDLLDECPVGEVDFYALPNVPASSITDPEWQPADGRSVPAAQYPVYAQLFGASGGNIELPAVSAPAGLTAYVCVAGEVDAAPLLSELNLYPKVPPAMPGSGPLWALADGASLPVASYGPLAAILGTGTGTTFDLPNVPATGVTGASWLIATAGIWPY